MPASARASSRSYCFHGYLPRESHQRKLKLKELEKEALKKNQTQLFIETPYRNQQVLEDVLSTLNDFTRLCIAFELTAKDEFIKTLTIDKWRKTKIEFHKKPAVFLIGK